MQRNPHARKVLSFFERLWNARNAQFTLMSIGLLLLVSTPIIYSPYPWP
jgi:hypothetical protein